MSSLAREHSAINLGQGFPDDPGPEDVRRKAADAVLNGYNQYPSMMGVLELREAIAAHYGNDVIYIYWICSRFLIKQNRSPFAI